jgi:GNAT superfamily N-acetyltransferase
MEERFEIRVAGPRDLLAMSDLMERQLRRYVLKDCTTPEGRRALLASITPEALQELPRRGYQYHVAASGADVFGIVGMRDASHLHHLFVAESVRGTGMGRRLWEAARDAVCIHATAPPVFTTQSSLYAVPFFRALGFATTGPEEERDGIRMQPMRYVLLGRTTR